MFTYKKASYKIFTFRPQILLGGLDRPWQGINLIFFPFNK